jgi:hypothetical protein
MLHWQSSLSALRLRAMSDSEETGLGKPDDRFLASFKKQESLSDLLNKTNREAMPKLKMPKLKLLN